MKVIKIKHIEDCFNGSFIKELLFDKQVTKSYLNILSKYGTMKYYASFARPFYRLDFEDNSYIKGVEGNRTMRINIKNKNALNIFLDILKSV